MVAVMVVASKETAVLVVVRRETASSATRLQRDQNHAQGPHCSWSTHSKELQQHSK